MCTVHVYKLDGRKPLIKRYLFCIKGLEWCRVTGWNCRPHHYQESNPESRRYADDLLGTSDQSNLGSITNRDAAFVSNRGYVNAPRTAKLLRPGSPIIFYKSKRDGKGRGAAVAIARITSAVIVAKAQLDAESDKRLVIDDADQFSATDDVLLTTFDNLCHSKPLSD